MKKAVFLDRDGTINEEINYLYRSEDFKFINGAVEAIKILNQAGYLVIVMTNQAGIARGYYTEEDLVKLHNYIDDELEKNNAKIDAYYYCPHHPEHGLGKYLTECSCRKPEIGMFEKAKLQFDIDKANSYMIGDNAGDILAGKAFGIKTILVNTGHGLKVREILEEQYDYNAKDILEAVKLII